MKYNKYHRHNYQNMVIIFLAIVWLEIKDTTNIRIEEFNNVSRELGHKINKKMLNNAMLKVKRTENMLKEKKSMKELEKEIKNKIKIVFQKDLNNIPYQNIQDFFPNKIQFEKTKIDMQLLADKILNKISYTQIQNLNYKAFTAGLIYYIGQTLRKKYHELIKILGDPSKLKL